MKEEPFAAMLRRTGQLWPENLTDDELMQALQTTRRDVSPLSMKMLLDEQMRRQRKLAS